MGFRRRFYSQQISARVRNYFVPPISSPLLSTVSANTAKIGDVVALTGTLVSISSVKIRGVTCSFSQISNSIITATIPNDCINGPTYFSITNNAGNVTGSITIQNFTEIFSGYTPRSSIVCW